MLSFVLLILHLYEKEQKSFRIIFVTVLIMLTFLNKNRDAFIPAAHLRNWQIKYK